MSPFEQYLTQFLLEAKPATWHGDAVFHKVLGTKAFREAERARHEEDPSASSPEFPDPKNVGPATEAGREAEELRYKRLKLQAKLQAKLRGRKRR